MSKTLEIPEQLYAEIDRFANRTATSPLVVLSRAWREFEQRHAQSDDARPASTQAELLAMARSLEGSLSLPSGQDDAALIAEARLEKYGPL